MFKRLDVLFLFLLLTLGVDIFYYHCLNCSISGIYRSPFATLYVIVIMSALLPSLLGSRVNLAVSFNLSVLAFIAIGSYSLYNFVVSLYDGRIQYYSLLLLLFLFYMIFFEISKNQINQSFKKFVGVIFFCLLVSFFLALASFDISATVHPFRGLLGIYVDGLYFRQKGLFSSPGALSLYSGLIILYCLTKLPSKSYLTYFMLVICVLLFWISDTRSAHLALFLTLVLLVVGKFVNRASIEKPVIVFLCIELIYFIQLGFIGLMDGANARFAIYKDSLDMVTIETLSHRNSTVGDALSLAGHSHNLLLDIFTSKGVIFGLLSYFAMVAIAICSYIKKKYLSFSTISFLLIFSQFDLVLVIDRLTISMGFLLIAILVYGVDDEENNDFAALKNR